LLGAAELGQHVTPALQLIAVAPLREHLYVVANFKAAGLTVAGMQRYFSLR
jgi:multidrug resistance efflux pump